MGSLAKYTQNETQELLKAPLFGLAKSADLTIVGLDLLRAGRDHERWGQFVVRFATKWQKTYVEMCVPEDRRIPGIVEQIRYCQGAAWDLMEQYAEDILRDHGRWPGDVLESAWNRGIRNWKGTGAQFPHFDISTLNLWLKEYCQDEANKIYPKGWPGQPGRDRIQKLIAASAPQKALPRSLSLAEAMEELDREKLNSPVTYNAGLRMEGSQRYFLKLLKMAPKGTQEAIEFDAKESFWKEARALRQYRTGARIRYQIDAVHRAYTEQGLRLAQAEKMLIPIFADLPNEWAPNAAEHIGRAIHSRWREIWKEGQNG